MCTYGCNEEKKNIISLIYQSRQGVWAVTSGTLFCLLFNAVIKWNARFLMSQPLLQLLLHHRKSSHMSLLTIYEPDKLDVTVQAQKGSLIAYLALV